MIARALARLQRLPRFETAILLVATVLLVVIGVASERRKHGPRLDSYSTYDAAGGGYRAYFELLGREGVRVDRFTGHPAFLDASVDTLLWAEPLPFDPAQGETTTADARALEAWVRAGGNLTYIGRDDAAAKAGILHLPASRERDAHPHAPYVDSRLREAGVARVASAATVRWRIARRGVRVLLDDGFGPLVVRYGFGRGHVIATIDETLFTNAGIAAYDRARLAVALAAPLRSHGAVAFDEAVHGYAVPRHWWSVVPRPFVIALALATFALLVAFAGAAVRLGPPVVPVAAGDRTSADFIDGLASLLERGRAVRSALADALTSTSRLVARVHGLPDGATHGEIAARIESDDARAAYRELAEVATNGFASESNLVRGAALAQRLRKEFAAHGRH